MNFEPKTIPINHSMLPDVAEKQLEQLQAFQEMMMRYQCAVLAVQP